MFKILLISYYFPPVNTSVSLYLLKLAKHLKLFNWEPCVITPENVAAEFSDLELLNESKESGIRIIRTKGVEANSIFSKLSSYKNPFETIRKLFAFLTSLFYPIDCRTKWSRKAYKTAKKLMKEEKFDVIYVCAPPFSFAKYGVKLNKKFKIPFFLDYRELWTGNAKSIHPTFFHKIVSKRREDKVLRKANKLIASNRRIKEILLKKFKYLTYNDIIILPNGFDPSDFESFRPLKRERVKINMIYSSSSFEYENIKSIMKALRKLAFERPDAIENIELNISGFLLRKHERIVRKYKLDKYVKILGGLNRRETVKKINQADFVLSLAANRKNSSAILPSNIYDCMAARKSLFLCACEGAATQIAKEYKKAVIADINNIDSIKQSFIEIYQMFKRNEAMEYNEDFIHKYESMAITDQLVRQLHLFLKAD